MPKPTLAELRKICQPPELMSRRSAEHWVGRLYGRRVSIRITSVLIRTPVRADHVTYLMIIVGVLGALALVIPGVVGPLIAAVSIQLYLILDCVDGELARWHEQSSKRGVYLDRVGHYVVEAALFSAYGFHVGQSIHSGWLSVGLATALFAILGKAETDLVITAGGRSVEERGDTAVIPRSPAVRLARKITHPLRVHRLLGAVEASLVMLGAAIVESFYDGAEQVVAVSFLAIAAAVMVGHGLSILSSGRFD